MRLFGIIRLPSLNQMFKKGWFRKLLIWVGVVALFAAIWFGFPMIPLDITGTIWLRAAVIGGLLSLIVLVWFFKWRRRRRAARSLEDSLMPAPVGDGAVLAERMQAALTKLKASGGKTYLYDLPWYIVIGPPGAGKTTALRNAGIEFPGSDGPMEAAAGFGGTRNVDWWFAEDAVLIDTAGRYVTQDSDAEADSASWTAFLDLLKKGRPNAPINGVILAFSIEDMMTATDEALAAHAATVRARLAEVHETLRIDFPVYMLFTKADLVSGFREYFASFTQVRRKAVWGTTFQTRDRIAQTWQQVPAELDALIERLSAEVIDRMTEEPDGVSRIAIFGLPGQMAMLKPAISEFMRRVFEPTRYKSNAILRGLYFTSGTQEGTPIDQVLGAMSRNQEGAAAFQPSFMSGKGKSFFLHDLLKKVIFAEADWVGHDESAVRRSRILRGTGITLVTTATLAAMAAFGFSFWSNARLVGRAEAQAAVYTESHERLLFTTVVDDADPTPVLTALQDARSITAGYGDEREPTMWEGFGLSQHNRINIAAEATYSDALERLLRPRMILHLEEELPRMIAAGDTTAVYRALKVYMLVGRGERERTDDAAVQAYFEDLWLQEVSGPNRGELRDQLNAHLAAMLELDDDREIEVAIDEAIIADARNAIANLPLAEQAYAAITDRAALSGIEPFNLVSELGGDVARVFETVDGSPMSDLGVPPMFTLEGYWGYFYEEAESAEQRMLEDNWVLGEAAEQVGYNRQLANLSRDLHDAYLSDFRDAWDGMLSRIALAPHSVDGPTYDVLAATASPVASPLMRLAEAVDRQTRLTRVYDAMAGLSPADLVATGGGLVSDTGDLVMSRLFARGGAFGRVLRNTLEEQAKAQERVGGAIGVDEERDQAERISLAFEDWHLLVRGELGARPVDAILRGLGALRESRVVAARAPSVADEATLQQQLSALTLNNTSLPDTMARLLNEIENEFRSVAEDATMTELNQALNDQVTRFCQDNVISLAPFGNGRPVAPSVFGQLFGPSGRMDSFYNTYLQQHVTRTSDGLRPREGSSVGERLSLPALRQFERAEAIRTAFFASGSPEPEVSMFVSHVSSSPTVDLAFLTMNGEQVRSRPGDTPGSLTWPGLGAGAAIELFPAEEGRNGARQFGDGRWAIVDFLRAGSPRVEGNVATVTYQVGGRSIAYRIEFDSTTVPFLMPELTEFACPTSLE